MAITAMLQPQKTSLTSNDTAVLSALFDPESSPSSSISVSKSALTLPHTPNPILPDLQKREIDAIRSLTTETPPQSSIETAISNLSVIINDYPNYAPAYLNRAQATRLLIGEETNLFLPHNHDLLSDTFSDLNKAISLISPSCPTDPLSDLQASLLSKAHTHRGYLFLKASQALNQSKPSLPTELAGTSSEQLEEMASKDFSLGGRYGNKIARQLSVKTNPYAKMCSAIVKEAMRKEREDYVRESA